MKILLDECLPRKLRPFLRGHPCLTAQQAGLAGKKIGELLIVLVITIVCGLAAEDSRWQDPSPHHICFVTVDQGVKLEVLDWGGAGRPLVLLAGLGNTAHVFDDFAPKLTGKCHVYGVTRRGFGASSQPTTGYSADRLGDDVLAVIDSLRLERPVLAGHSIAGEELSSVSSRHPERVSGLIYLDAGYPYAFYDREVGDREMDSRDLAGELDRVTANSTGFAERRRQVTKLLKQVDLDNADDPVRAVRIIRRLLATEIPSLKRDVQGIANPPVPVQEMLGETLPALERDLRKLEEGLKTAPPARKEAQPTRADLSSFAALQRFMARDTGFSFPEAELRQLFVAKPNGAVGKPRETSKASEAINTGTRKYARIAAPVLAIFSIPEGHGSPVDAISEAQANAFRRGVTSARVVILPHADHYVFLSNEADVLHEVGAFLADSPR